MIFAPDIALRYLSPIAMPHQYLLRSGTLFHPPPYNRIDKFGTCARCRKYGIRSSSAPPMNATSTASQPESPLVGFGKCTEGLKPNGTNSTLRHPAARTSLIIARFVQTY